MPKMKYIDSNDARFTPKVAKIKNHKEINTFENDSDTLTKTSITKVATNEKLNTFENDSDTFTETSITEVATNEEFNTSENDSASSYDHYITMPLILMTAAVPVIYSIYHTYLAGNEIGADEIVDYINLDDAERVPLLRPNDIHIDENEFNFDLLDNPFGHFDLLDIDFEHDAAPLIDFDLDVSPLDEDAFDRAFARHGRNAELEIEW